MVGAKKEATEPMVHFGKVEVITSKIDCYGISVSQMATDMFQLS
jgi:hypothetical protein